MSYKPYRKPLTSLNTKIPVNQLVVGSIPTAGARKQRGLRHNRFNPLFARQPLGNLLPRQRPNSLGHRFRYCGLAGLHAPNGSGVDPDPFGQFFDADHQHFCAEFLELFGCSPCSDASHLARGSAPASRPCSANRAVLFSGSSKGRLRKQINFHFRQGSDAKRFACRQACLAADLQRRRDPDAFL